MKIPASLTLIGFTPPVLKMKANGRPPDVKEPRGPKGFEIVSSLLATEQVAVVLIGDIGIVPIVGAEIVHAPGTRLIDKGNLMVI